MQSFFRRTFAIALLFGALGISNAAEADVNAGTSSGRTDEATAAIRRFRAAPGMKIDLFASEPMIRNVVSFAFDEHGRCYVVDSDRRRTSVFDIRGLGEWLDNDFSFRTVEDRANFFKSTFSPTNTGLAAFLKKKKNLLSDFNHDGTIDWHDLEVESERIRLLVDTNSDGHADVAATLAEGFDGITSGVAAGVLARKGEVWFTCIPDLWKITNDELRMTKGMPSADSMPANPHLVNHKSKIEELLSGFGVHIAFGGHDMHGLKMGPDGKIYFSIADRATGTNLWDKIVDHWPGLTMEALANSGAIFRCEPDGTQFEVVAIGLRNPQELAFDEFGNLFTGDNNADGGDKARWEYIVEGADYGWRMGWQWLPKLGAWNSEMLWGLADKNTSAYFLPPVAHIGAGPSGIAYYPGTGLPARYDRHFFMCDFRGGPNSVVRSFALRPKGASFEAYDESEFLTGPLCTDVDFGLDGAVYVSDWVKGWDKTDKARIYRVFDPNLVNDPAMLEVKKLLGEGMEKRSNQELAQLLGHRDMRVRLEAQFQLVEKDEAEILAKVAKSGTSQIARIHAVQGLVQLYRGYDRAKIQSQVYYQRIHPVLKSLLSDTDAEIRAQAIRALGLGEGVEDFEKRVTPLLHDPSPRVRFYAVQALGKQGAGIHALLEVLRDNKNQDVYLRHAVVFALRIDDGGQLLAAAKDESPAVRLGVCLALRRLKRPEIAEFLRDSDPQIVLEAARAIYDVPIPEALPALARMMHPFPLWQAEAHDPKWAKISSPLLRRAMNAQFRLGGEQNAQELASFAVNPIVSEALQVEALELLAQWPKPAGRDHVVGLWRPLPPRNGKAAAQALEEFAVRRLETNAPVAVKLALNKATAALASKEEENTASPVNAQELASLAKALTGGTLAEKQNAFDKLGTLSDAGAVTLLQPWVDQLAAGTVPRELRLDVLQAVQQNPVVSVSAATKETLAKFDATRDSKDALAKWRECLYGGNAEEGKKTFIERQDAACFRCHKINGEGGEVGPELAGVGTKHPREYLLESILFPNKSIAPGFESVLVTLKNGTSYAGLLKSETATELVINSPEDGPVTVKKADVKSRDRGLSAMPEEMGNILSKSDIRNLIEFLSTLK